MKRSLWTALLSVTLVGCAGDDRGEEFPGWGPGNGDDGDVTGDDDGGDDGDTGADTGDDGGDSGDGDPGGSTNTGGEDEDTGTGDPPDEGGTDDTGDPPGGDDPVDETPPDCNPYLSLWPSKASAEPPTTREEFWCYINRKRTDSYITHGRSNGPGENGGDGSVTWPYEMGWDKDLMDLAQAEAERVAGGGAPAGGNVSGGFGAKSLWIDGQNSADYTLTTQDDHVTDWWDPTPCCHEPSQHSGISVGNGAARMGLYYHDYSGAGPVLTSMGVGMVEDQNGARTWVVKLAP